MSTAISVAALVVAVVATLASAWGPTSHFYYTCTGLGISTVDCLGDQNHHLLSGTEMPDAFAFPAMLVMPGGVCFGMIDLHSDVFGGYLFQEAPKFNSPTFNATDFALGFGMHTVADLASASQHGGYLAKFGNPVNYLEMWPLMTAVDSYISHRYFDRRWHRAVPTNIPEVNDEMAAFVAHTTTVASKATNGGFPVANASLVKQCASQWQWMAGNETARAAAMPREAYEFEMTHADQFGAKNFTVARAHWELARECSVNAAGLWAGLMMNNNTNSGTLVTPQSANAHVMKYLDSAFAAGKCAPL